ncbi:MAG: rfbG [Lachnospiraceae bacterium]|jgi:CDP-glucose 4,6-dehydratase|nr:rfbG [Lachnospiraceae bacterium]
MNHDFWKDKKVLITGHTGFKGSWLSIWLHKLGAQVIGYSLDPSTEKDNFVLSGISNKLVDIRGDIRNFDLLQSTFLKYQPEIIFHLAAQPLVRLSYENPKDTYEINVMGTMNLLECMKNTEASKTGIMITTDKCYENQEQIWGYRETDRFGGYDPYSSSKACAEILISSYRNSFFPPNHYDKHGKSIASVRAGNVIGGGDWAKDRIVPDCIKAIENGNPISIRNPKAIRPWQHVLEPLAGYINLAEKLHEEPEKYGEGWNFGPEYNSFANVWDIAERIISGYGAGKLLDCSDEKNPHETNLLFLDITKVKSKLGWTPKFNLEEIIYLTTEWYKKYKTVDVYEMCVEQINYYENKL